MIRVRLAYTNLRNRKDAYDWLYHSDILEIEDSPTDPPDIESPSYEEFRRDYPDYFFDGSSPGDGRCFLIEVLDSGEQIGMISYTSFHLKPGVSELDIWLKARKYIDHGYGTEALRRLCDSLFMDMDYHTLIIRPYRKNLRAVKSYEKVGFLRQNMDPEIYYKKEFIHSHANGDFGPGEDIFMVMRKKDH